MLLQRLKDALRRLTTTPPTDALPETASYHLQGQAEVSATRVRLTRRNGNNEEIAWAAIDFITADRYEGSSPADLCWVNFRSFRAAAVCIPSTALGFDRIAELLNTLDGVDTTKWNAFRDSTQPVSNVVLWQKPSNKDFAIPESDHSPTTSFDTGIHLENLNQWLPWGTYDELARHSFVRSKSEPYPNPDFSGLRYVIPNPVIANGLHLKHLYTLTDAARSGPNLDLPVLCYTSDISLGARPQVGFTKIRSHLDRYFGVNSNQEEPDCLTPQTLEAQWEKGRTKVSLRCFYRDELQSWDNVAWLQIHHNPDVTRYYTSEYGDRLTLSKEIKWKTFAMSLEIAADYRHVSNALYTPRCFEGVFPENHQLLIWVDTAACIIGFANRELALTFDLRTCTNLMLITRRFRGYEEGSSLELHSGGTSTPLGGLSDAVEFQRQEEAIAHLTGLKTGKCVYDEYY